MAIPDIQTLLTNLHSADTDKQIRALGNLAELGVHSAVPKIIPLLSSPDYHVREAAVVALEELGTITNLKAIGEALLPLLNDEESFVRNRAVEAIGPLAYPAAIQPLQHLLHHDHDWLVRASAAEALGNFGDASLIPYLQRALDDEEETVQSYAAYSLGLIATPTFLPVIEQYIAAKANSPRVQRELIIASYRLGAPNGIERLLDLLKSVDEKYEALRLLNGIRPLTEQRVPPSLRSDTPLLREALKAFEQRFPIWHTEIKQILNNLTKLEQAKWGGY